MRRHLSGSGPPLIGDQSADPRPTRNTPADQGERAGTERMRTLSRNPPASQYVDLRCGRAESWRLP